MKTPAPAPPIKHFQSPLSTCAIFRTDDFAIPPASSESAPRITYPLFGSVPKTPLPTNPATIVIGGLSFFFRGHKLWDGSSAGDPGPTWDEFGARRVRRWAIRLNPEAFSCPILTGSTF